MNVWKRLLSSFLSSAGVYPPLSGLQEGGPLWRPPAGQWLVPSSSHEAVQFVGELAGHSRKPCLFRNNLLLISMADRSWLMVLMVISLPSTPRGGQEGGGAIYQLTGCRTRPHRPQWLPLILGQEWPMSFPVWIQMSVRARTIWKLTFVFTQGILWSRFGRVALTF